MPEKKPARKKATLKQTVAAPQIRPTMGAVLDHFFAQIGGPEVFAKKLVDDYNNSPAGSQTRGKIIDIVARCLKSQDTKTGLADDLGILNEEDLEREIERREAAIRPYVEGATDGQPGRPGPQPEQPPADRPGGEHRHPAAAPAAAT